MGHPDHGPPDPDDIYRGLGQFIVVFQLVENQVRQIGEFVLQSPHAGHARRSLVDLTFAQLRRRTLQAIDGYLDGQHRPASDFRQRFLDLLAECADLAHYRNAVVHSTYIFLEGGGELRGIIRSDMIKAAEPKEIDFDHELLSAESFHGRTVQAAELAFSLGLCRTQLIAWNAD